MWKYYENNISTDRVVAAYTNSNGVHVLDVLESKNCHFTRPLHSFIKPCQIPYRLEVDKKEEEGLSTEEVLLMRLKKACKLIEKNYNEQVFLIKLVI